jgi:phage baseplate assembly protein W
MSTYRDLDLSFATHPVTGDLVVKKDIPAVIQSVRTLVLTSAGEILWEPLIGGGVGKLLFELNDDLVRIQLYERIKQTILRFEPRVEIAELQITRFENGNGIYIKLKFYILNNPEPITETIPIKRLR